MAEVVVSYQVITDEKELKELARKISIEQSVETPESLITDAIESRYLGQLKEVSIVNGKPNTFNISLAYPEEIVSQQYNQLINLCFGNVSMYPNVKLIDISLPEHLLDIFSGPNYGITGIRDCLGVYGRPLLATALKPRGYTNEQFANMCYEFALGGGDIIKDDQNLVSNFDDFKQRVSQCLLAIDKAQQSSGKACLYFPFISAPFEEIEKYFVWVKAQGVKGVLLAPLILGLDTARGLAAKYDLIYMAHPSFTGSYCVSPNEGMSYHLLYGLFYRLAGVDISVYPNTGGRFEFSEQDCKDIADELRRPLGNIKPAFPCPAGGMQYFDLQRMCDWYKQDSVLLLGGSLLEYSSSLKKSTQAFKDKLNTSFEEKIIQAAKTSLPSSCEYGHETSSPLLEYIEFDNYEWSGREKVAYKNVNDSSFKNIKRVELVGKNDGHCQFDLRYFEIAQNGYSTKEMHEHVHVIIGARGQGKVIVDNKEYEVKENDVLYIKPMAIHQLLNSNVEAFGFYCIVDRKRDKPIIAQ